MKIEHKYSEKSSRARVIVALSLTLFLLFLVWLASLMVIASLSVARGSHHLTSVTTLLSRNEFSTTRMDASSKMPSASRRALERA